MEAVVELQIAATAVVVGMRLTLQHTPAEAHRVGLGRLRRMR